MRKTLMALIIVLPLLFVLVIFSSLNLISLSVNIAVNGIKITTERGEERLLIDIAEYQTRVKLTAEISPSNATDKRYSLESEDPSIVEVEEDGTLTPHKEGSTNIIATSNDMGFTDSMPVTVTSSKAYDFTFSLFRDDKSLLKTNAVGDYYATVDAGEFSYDIDIAPIGFDNYNIAMPKYSFATVNKGEKTMFIPFSGETDIEVTVPDGVGGEVLSKKVRLTVKKPGQRGSIVVNGSADNAIINLTKGVKSTVIYVECDDEPTFSSPNATGTVRNIGKNRYQIDIVVNDDFDVNADDAPSLSASIKSGANTADVNFTYKDFEFFVKSTRKIEERDADELETFVLTRIQNTYYAYANAHVENALYKWSVLEGAGDGILLTANDGETCYITPTDKGTFKIKIEAEIDGKVVASKTMQVKAYDRVVSTVVSNTLKTDASLEATYTVAGKKFAANMADFEDVHYGVDVSMYVRNPDADAGVDYLAGDDTLEYELSDDSLAEIEITNGKAYLVPKSGEGNVIITINWIGNELFGTNVTTSFNVNVVADAVEVKNDPELRKAMELKKKAVLAQDIKLGVDANGRTLEISERRDVLAQNRMKSTYNIEYYKMAGQESNAYVSYVLEFTADVYGNGHKLDADNFTHCLEASGQSGDHKPIIDLYSGPLYFVNANGNLAHVAGQDNCAYLVRTDGIKLYGISLLGCSDSSINDNNSGESDATLADLQNLNYTGTTLEINASCDIINCRIRNGRNVVRVYGGNRNGNNYSVTNTKQVNAEQERIKVNIEGCIIAQGREFLVKVGTNHALRSTSQTNTEPKFTDENGRPYATSGNSNNYSKLYENDYFYDNYVLTDLTISDSVLEKSGLFCVGIESNFAGPMLAPGYDNIPSESGYAAVSTYWRNSGGTSFAAVLRFKGDVRLYDWKNLALVNSDTLIEGEALKEWMKLDINKMLEFVSRDLMDKYGDLLIPMEGEDMDKDGSTDNYVHGGIAFYGGGINYSQLDVDGLDASFADFKHVNINISILAGAADGKLQSQGNLLPKAAGSNDFNFYLYPSTSVNNYDKQVEDGNQGLKYKGVTPKPLFE